MSIFAAKPSATVRQRPSQLLTKSFGVIVFVGVAVAAFAWKFRQSPQPPAAATQATSRLLIHHPAFNSQRAWQEILAQSKAEIREHLKFESQESGQATAVSISLGDQPREAIAPLVNMVASAYGQACRSQWKAEVEQACTQAQEKLRTAEREAADVDARLGVLRDRQRGALTAAGERADPSPATIENPQWTEAAHRLADLEERRRVLLFERTPLHPSVQEIEMHISDMRREMAAIPARIAQRPAAEAIHPQTVPLAPSPAELSAAEEQVDKSRDQVRQLDAAVQTALAERNAELRIDLEPAETPASLVTSPRFAWSILAAALFTAATSIVGLGMISYGASLEPALASIAELQSALPVPVLGVLPAVHPAPSARRSASRQRFMQATVIASGLAMLIAMAWFAF